MTHDTDDDDHLTPRQAAELLGVSLSTLRNWTSAGRISHSRLGPKLIRYRRGDLLAWLEAHKVAGEDAAGADGAATTGGGSRS